MLARFGQLAKYVLRFILKSEYWLFTNYNPLGFIVKTFSLECKEMNKTRQNDILSQSNEFYMYIKTSTFVFLSHKIHK